MDSHIVLMLRGASAIHSYLVTGHDQRVPETERLAIGIQ